MDEIFQYLAHADKPCIVAIDEFQQIARYPEKNIEAQLWTHIQKLDNCHFIFAGSERHSLTSASSVQSAVKKLLEKDIITEINHFFSVTDKLLAMWINKLYGNKDYNLT